MLPAGSVNYFVPLYIKYHTGKNNTMKPNINIEFATAKKKFTPRTVAKMRLHNY